MNEGTDHRDTPREPATSGSGWPAVAALAVLCLTVLAIVITIRVT